MEGPSFPPYSFIVPILAGPSPFSPAITLSSIPQDIPAPSTSLDFVVNVATQCAQTPTTQTSLSPKKGVASTKEQLPEHRGLTHVKTVCEPPPADPPTTNLASTPSLVESTRDHLRDPPRSKESITASVRIRDTKRLTSKDQLSSRC